MLINNDYIYYVKYVFRKELYWEIFFGENRELTLTSVSEILC